ncbi:virulence RhuM family protein [Corynebacterium pseudodiphtheriticum]|uniref:virulence RhuM family protein n=1 Tax=Corynebacterium pseudodiphtheriticum TaxID=37637 RepID=UPI00254FAC1D|nr:virulence RhuM family protein [Corynebacterium pseudodiphtheriticum]MDK8614690.1 virulence RhuM family protein [Corynebacterium pseudodiphtheriticum]MDK8738486.1 virulence RhuM family protein [Corynebacterium pseudodiphtheriticum]MDK8745028.1 virulence RhuM family protein [Corynebacterium pseudodiphtheriticum]
MSDKPRSVGISSVGPLLTFTATDLEHDLLVRYEQGTIWLTQALMGELFGVDKRTVSEHLRNIFASRELDGDSVVRKIRTTADDGKNYQVKHYNLDAIISVGYRVNSKRATQFRIWATKVLRDFTLRGFVVDKQRMEQGEIFGDDYFEQLLQEIREIRLSERCFYQKVTDIYATATDYDKDAPVTKTFFATVQNKLHYAVHGHTAAELIHERASADKMHMGLTTWNKAPDGKVLAGDVTVGKNYLSKTEIKDLGRLVETFLNLAESRAERQIPTTMEQWAGLLDQVLSIDGRELLKHAGKISKKLADEFALGEFSKFRVEQDKRFKSDFDAFIEAGENAVESIKNDDD